MRTENSFVGNYTRIPVTDVSGGGADQLSVPLNTVHV